MSISVVVCGMDPRSQLWPPFKHGFDKYWPDCPWTKYFITNRLEGPEGFRTIRTGKEFSWADKTITALELIDSELLLWMMEDFWLPGPVQTKVLVEFYELMLKHKNIDHIRLMPPSGIDGIVIPDKECREVSEFDNRLWHFKRDASYRVSVTASFWRKDSLLSYIKDGMDPWMFENEGSVASYNSPNLYLCLVDPYVFPIPHYTNPYQQQKNEMVSKGIWNKSAVEYIKREGLTMDFSTHPNGLKNTGLFL
jgi:hypothetical protein